jgi:tRNA (guanine37-N1)-methyltransferase
MEQENVSQWGIRVARKDAEETRRTLLREGIIDRALKPRRDGDDIIFPVTEKREGAAMETFEAHPDREDLPRHELIGGIAVMQEKDVAAAELLLNSRPSLHTVLFPVSDVEGEFRTRRFEVLAGTPETRTVYTEYGHRFVIDLSAAYFSARLSTERQRIFDQVQEGELVLDMFAGVGPFAITVAKKAKLVVAADINAGAVELMVGNLALNRVKNVLPVLSDAGRLGRLLPWKFDRIIMNFPTGAWKFLPGAASLCRAGGTIHCYALQSGEGEVLPRIRDLPGVTKVKEHYVRSYSPGRWHAVYDIVF